MSLKIEQDHNRFKQIIKGRIKRELRKYMSKGEMIGKKGKDLVSIPLPQIDLPHFKYGTRKTGGVGQGEGQPGQSIGQGDPEEGEGQGHAGNLPGHHIEEVDITLEELAQILGEELELPNILPKGRKNVQATKDKYTGITRAGPESLRHFKRTYKQALRREISSGVYNPSRPIIPTREDKRYRSWKEIPAPERNAVIVYIMDVSGSMGDEQKEIVRIESFWIDTWLRHQYDGIDSRYIIHDATAKEVDSDTFYKTRESGGTLISSAYKLAAKLIEQNYPSDEWNTYVFHFSDGDNWSGNDTAECMKILESRVLPKVNLFCYGQVESEYGSGQFYGELEEFFGARENLTLSKIEDKDAIYQSIKDFLGKGK